MATLFAPLLIVAWLIPTLSVVAVCYITSRIGTGWLLFNLHNYTAIAYPTRIRSVAFAWTDSFGHLGAWDGVTIVWVQTTAAGSSGSSSQTRWCLLS